VFVCIREFLIDKEDDIGYLQVLVDDDFAGGD